MLVGLLLQMQLETLARILFFLLSLLLVVEVEVDLVMEEMVDLVAEGDQTFPQIQLLRVAQATRLP